MPCGMCHKEFNLQVLRLCSVSRATPLFPVRHSVGPPLKRSCAYHSSLSSLRGTTAWKELCFNTTLFPISEGPPLERSCALSLLSFLSQRDHRLKGAVLYHSSLSSLRGTTAWKELRFITPLFSLSEGAPLEISGALPLLSFLSQRDHRLRLAVLYHSSLSYLRGTTAWD